MDTISLIIVICVLIPALFAISICMLLYHSHRKTNRKFQHSISLPNEYTHSPERVFQNNHMINFSSAYRYQQQRHLPEYSTVFERSPPSYESSIYQTRKQELPLSSRIHTKSLHQISPAVIPSIYSVMPPSYAEIFLTPHTLTN